MVAWLSLLDANICLGHDRIGQRIKVDTLQAVTAPRAHDLFLPELYRFRADLSLRAGARDGVIETHPRRTMELAHAQQARLILLRSATDLGRLCQIQDKRRDTY